MNLNQLSAAFDHITQTQFLLLAGALLVLVCWLLLLLRRQPKHVVAYTTENGRVMVSRHTIVELVQTSCEQLQNVSKPQVKIKVKGQTTHFEVRIKLLSGGRLRQIEQTLQSHLRKALTENLGIESLGCINIVAIGFKSGRIDSTLPTESETAPVLDTDETYTKEEPFAIDNESNDTKKD